MMKNQQYKLGVRKYARRLQIRNRKGNARREGERKYGRRIRSLAFQTTIKTRRKGETPDLLLLYFFTFT